MIRLTASNHLRLTVDPRNGAAVRAFDFLNCEGNWVPVLQPADPSDCTANGSAMFPMVPFANRARGNVLRIGSTAVPLSPNTTDPLAIHGYGWQRVWRTKRHDADSCVLVLDADPAMPLCFEARIGVFVGQSEAEFTLDVTNPGSKPIPAGLGWHPYFPHLDRTALRFSCEAFWLEGPDHLPTDSLRVPTELDFSAFRRVPSRHCTQNI